MTERVERQLKTCARKLTAVVIIVMGSEFQQLWSVLLGLPRASKATKVAEMLHLGAFFA